MDNSEQKVTQMEPIYCKKGAGHKGLPIVMICLESECTRKRLCCLTCVDDLHCKHELISVKKFQHYVSSTLNHNVSVANRDQMIGMISNTRQQFKEKIQTIKIEFGKKIQAIFNQLQEHFQKIQNTFEKEKYENVGLEIIQQFTEEKVEQFFKLTKQAENNLVKSIVEIQNAVKASQKFLSEQVNSYMKDIEKNSGNLEKAIKNFKITGKTLLKIFKFNIQTKAASLIIQEDGKKVRRGEGSGGYPIALVDHPFSEQNNTVRFKIVEEPGNKACWLGVCAVNIVKNLNYQSCYGLNKGTWAIDQVGQNHVSAYSWSHHDPNFNSAPKVGFQFSIGDVISIKVNFQTSTAIFTKNDSISYQQPIKLDLGPIYAFAGPTNIDDVFTIV